LRYVPAWISLKFWVPFRSWHRSDDDVQRLRRSVHRVNDHHEESLNATTHAVGLVCSVAAAVAVVGVAATHGVAWHIWGCSLYAASLVAAYTASTLSHVARRPRWRHTFRVADQAVIFLFIAGSYTPVALAWLRGGPWWALHGLLWAVALTGFISKAAFTHNVRLGAVSTRLYLVLSWLPLLAAWPLIATLPPGLLMWMFAGGLCYTLGIVFFHYDHRVRYFHAVWHVMVLAGSACHYMGILLYCTGW
jgi:hemolysin III